MECRPPYQIIAFPTSPLSHGFKLNLIILIFSIGNLSMFIRNLSAVFSSRICVEHALIEFRHWIQCAYAMI